MSGFIARVENAAQQLNLAGNTLNADEIAYQLISRLPTNYEITVVRAYDLSDSEFIPKTVQALLLSEFERQKVAAMVELTNYPNQASYSSRSSTVGRHFHRQQSQKRSIECFKCHKIGHITKDCRSNYTDDVRTCSKCLKKGHKAQGCRGQSRQSPNRNFENQSSSYNQRYIKTTDQTNFLRQLRVWWRQKTKIVLYMIRLQLTIFITRRNGYTITEKWKLQLTLHKVERQQSGQEFETTEEKP